VTTGPGSEKLAVRGCLATMTIPNLTLNDDTSIPQLGFGVFQVPPADTAETVTRALEVGYRHIDTAEMYQNEKGVGEAIASSGIPRDELYVTSKLNNAFHEPDDARRAFDQTLTDLGLDRIDLFLIHWPLPTLYDGDYVSTGKTLTEFVGDGRARSVGVSNFQPAHLTRIIDEIGVIPAVNQIEVHPFFTNESARTASFERGIKVEAWSPIAQGKVIGNEVIGGIGSHYGKSASQVTLRWHVERGDIVFPKSMRAQRMRENFEIFDFSLTPDEVAAISALNQGEAGRIGPNPDVMAWVPRRG
jgi:2,5-diketo-D-gluconate reductase A